MTVIKHRTAATRHVPNDITKCERALDAINTIVSFLLFTDKRTSNRHAVSLSRLHSVAIIMMERQTQPWGMGLNYNPGGSNYGALQLSPPGLPIPSGAASASLLCPSSHASSWSRSSSRPMPDSALSWSSASDDSLTTLARISASTSGAGGSEPAVGAGITSPSIA